MTAFLIPTVETVTFKNPSPHTPIKVSLFTGPRPGTSNVFTLVEIPPGGEATIPAEHENAFHQIIRNKKGEELIIGGGAPWAIRVDRPHRKIHGSLRYDFMSPPADDDDWGGFGSLAPAPERTPKRGAKR